VTTADWHAAPVFGTREDGVRYTIRPSAYGLAQDDRGRIAVVRTPQGMYLPGGGIETGEAPAEAVVRELMEECGLVVCAGRWLGRAVQFLYSKSERTHFEKWSTFLDVSVESVGSSGVEADHELVWTAPSEASAILTDGSHRWAVEQWISRPIESQPAPPRPGIN
jgi:8-oxo-dGTP diphosphatase